MSTHDTPRGNRLHIVLFGRCNAGKSSLLNALCAHQVAVVSSRPGTTTDVVRKHIELPGLGPCVLLDTAGFDDADTLASLRIQHTQRALDEADAILLLIDATMFSASPSLVDALQQEVTWLDTFRRRRLPVIPLLTKVDALSTSPADLCHTLTSILSTPCIPLSAHNGVGQEALLQALRTALADKTEVDDLLGSLVTADDVVLLVMPQDASAPRGRLILPQVQTLRCLLDKGCTALCCTPERLPDTLAALKAPPALLITDSQAFAAVAPLCPPSTRLTSFSVLLARQKGDIRRYLLGAETLMNLRPGDRILIAEACTHKPQNEDIGRVKLPRLLRTRLHPDLHIDIVSGSDFPADLTPYRLVIHCGACMFTRRYVLTRLARATEQGVPVTNYGIALAALTGTLSRLSIPD